MSTKYPGGLITKTPVTPAGPYQDGAAPGIWTLDQATNYIKQGIWPTAGNIAIGAAYGGGFFAGQIGVGGVATHNLVIGPVSTAQNTLAWRNVNAATPGADSDINGPQNTADMVADGNSTVYPAAHFCKNLSIGGKTDWYMPAKNELEVCYYNLKPTTASNNTSSGINPNAVPARASNYTAGTPAQTTAADFITSTGAQAFLGAGQSYWSSTEVSSDYGLQQVFSIGTQRGNQKYRAYPVRAIRRVAV